MSAVRKFDEKAVQTGCHSIIKDAEKYALELHLTRTESLFKVTTEDGDGTLAKTQQKAYCICGTLREKKLQVKLTNNRWEYSALDSGGCFARMNS